MAKDMYQKRKKRQENKKNETYEDKKTNINWYPGHMKKARDNIKEKLDLVDIIYEVIDARIPYSSKIKDIDNIIKNKPCILIMTKYDLCDKEETNKFVSYYKKKGYYVLCFDLVNDKNVNEIYNISDKLLKSFNEKRKEKGLKPRLIRALVLGIPNVGKSTLINKLVNKKAVKVGNKPGITTSISWIRIGKDIELLDTPGILWPKIDDVQVGYNLASMGSIKEEILPRDMVVDYILNKLSIFYPQILFDKYNVSNYKTGNFEQIIFNIGKKKGYLIKGGEVDFEKTLISILNDIKEEKIIDITFDRYGDVYEK